MIEGIEGDRGLLNGETIPVYNLILPRREYMEDIRVTDHVTDYTHQ